MSNIIKGVDFGMGYEQATKWKPGLQSYHPRTRNTWEAAAAVNQEDLEFGIRDGWIYRRKLPILANHPEAIPLEPGDVLQVGDRGLTRDGRDTGELEETQEVARIEAGLILFSKALKMHFMPNGSFWPSKTEGDFDIIARLPKVAREAEKAKEEKVEEDRVQIGTLFPKLADVAKAVIENPKIMAEVRRQEEAKRIRFHDWINRKGSIARVEGVYPSPPGQGAGFLVLSDGSRCPIDEPVKKIQSPDLIAALNAEIDAKAGG